MDDRSSHHVSPVLRGQHSALGLVCASLCLATACIDLQFGTGQRISDSNILSGRPADEGGPTLARDATRIDSRDAHLEPLAGTLQRRAGFLVNLADPDFGPLAEVSGEVLRLADVGTEVLSTNDERHFLTSSGSTPVEGDLPSYDLALGVAMEILSGLGTFTLDDLIEELDTACRESALLSTQRVCWDRRWVNQLGEGLGDARKRFSVLAFRLRDVEASWVTSEDEDRCDPRFFDWGMVGGCVSDDDCGGICLVDENGESHCNSNCEPRPHRDGTVECACNDDGCSCDMQCQFDVPRSCSTHDDCEFGECRNGTCNVVQVMDCGPPNPVLKLTVALNVHEVQKDT